VILAGQKAIEKERIRYFVPTEIQEEFVRDKSFVRLFQGSNKSGKSTSGIIEIVSQCIGHRPYLSKSDPDYKTEFTPPIKVRIYGEDFTEHVGGVIVPILRKWIPHSEFYYREGNPKKNPQGIPTFWTFKNGSTLELLTYEQDSAKSEGWDGQFIHFDEPPPRDTYIAAKRGLVAENGKCIMTMTPIKEPWIYDEIWMRKDSDVRGFPADITTNLRHRRKWWRADMKNDGLAWCGYLNQEAIDRFERDLTDDEKEARLRGRFMHLSGLVYKEFNPSVHVQPYFKPPVTWTWYEAIDPATRKPWAVTIMAISPDETKYVVDEIFIKGVVSEVANAIKQKRDDYRYQPAIATIIDPIAVAEDPISKTSILNEFMAHGVFCQSGSKDRNRGIQLLKADLKIGEDEQKAGIYILENCRRTIHEFGHYVWDDFKKKVSGQKDIPKKTDDDMLENIHRILISGARYIEMKKSSGKQKEIRGIGTQ